MTLLFATTYHEGPLLHVEACTDPPEGPNTGCCFVLLDGGRAVVTHVELAMLAALEGREVEVWEGVGPP